MSSGTGDGDGTAGRGPGTPPDVTVVTVTYDAADLVGACLDGLAGQRLGKRTMDVVVVDNASSDGTADLVADRHPDVRLVRSPVNRGFAGGNNLALRALTSRYVVLLNNDAVPEPGFVAALVDAMDAADPGVAGLTATVLLTGRFRPATADDPDGARVTGPEGTWVRDPDGPVTLVNSTGNVVRRDGYGADRGWLADAARHHPPRAVFGFCGAAAVLRTSALRDVGLFDEDFFLYYEDSDLSWRLRLGGYRIEHCPDAVVHHVHAASTGEGSALFRFHDGRNRLLMLTKDARASLAVRAVGRYVLTTASIAVRRSQPRDHVVLRVRVLASYARLLPRMLRRRRAIGRAARAGRGDVERLLVEVPRTAIGGYRT
ncbi:glycosyltransferase family 2 protein [uncultured Cellulomonas sp.]|uniref:glycosyltransferase family 2 protein n=1 Tax=uncultured Cellulomonas sp. TaxID=189682 RepID=UPI002618DC1A|nr:glycosyltransferase family 2 protein [uncultured Cellulomonas sp.]